MCGYALQCLHHEHWDCWKDLHFGTKWQLSEHETQARLLRWEGAGHKIPAYAKCKEAHKKLGKKKGLPEYSSDILGPWPN